MDLRDIIELAGNFGVPTLLLFWIFFRLDKFLQELVKRLETYNKELGIIGLAIRDVVELLKRGRV